MAEHRACHGCIDGCTRESPVHCASCVHEPWPCDAYVRGRFLMGAAAEVHRFRQHPPYGSSFLDCDHTICQEHRVALGLPLHGYDPDRPPAAPDREA